MNVSVSQALFSQALGVVSHAVASKSSMPILSNIYLSAEDGDLRISATNLELGINYRIPAEVAEEGAVTVPAKLLIDFVNTLPDDTVSLELDAKTQTLSVRCKQVISMIKGIDASDFPPIPEFDENEAVTFNGSEFRKMISQVAFAASTEDARPILQGVYLSVEGKTMTMVATDGFRIAVRNVTLQDSFAEPISVIIPARTMLELVRITSDATKQIMMNLSANKNQVIFHMQQIELASQIIAGNYVDYKAIVPKNFKTNTVISTSALLKACTQAIIITRDTKYLTRFNISGEDNGVGKIQITAHSEETGFYENQIDANVDGPDLTIAFNARFLQDVLEVITTPNVSIRTNTNVSPGLIVPLDDELDYQYVIMPMHLG